MPSRRSSCQTRRAERCIVNRIQIDEQTSRVASSMIPTCSPQGELMRPEKAFNSIPTFSRRHRGHQRPSA